MTITEVPDTVDGIVDGGTSDAGEGAAEPHDPADEVANEVVDGTGDIVPGDARDGATAAGPEPDDTVAEADGTAPVDTVGDEMVADGVADAVAEDGDADPVDSADQVTVRNPGDAAVAHTWDGFAAGRADGAAPLNGAPLDGVAGATVQAATHEDGVDPAYAVDPGAAADPHLATDPADAGSTDGAYLVDETGPDGPPVHTDAPGSLAAVVAEHLAGPPPDGQLPDSRTDSAQAVLDVLRASGWSDAAETAELKAEVERLRELLDMVVRDHRARVATAANGQHQQAYWLVPLLRAAHGVAFGTLGAKVHLRTAVQDVPPDVLASAGLRIDDAGPAPEPEYR